MCLDSIAGKVVLEKDKAVWKFVHYNSITKAEKSIIGMKLKASGVHVTNLRKTGLIRDRHTGILIKRCDSVTGYRSGFHCCLTKSDCEIIGGSSDRGLGWLRRPGCTVLKYIIPKGTEVLQGKQNDIDMLVTPVLINPRAK